MLDILYNTAFSRTRRQKQHMNYLKVIEKYKKVKQKMTKEIVK